MRTINKKIKSYQNKNQKKYKFTETKNKENGIRNKIRKTLETKIEK